MPETVSMFESIKMSETIAYLTQVQDEDWLILQSVAPKLEEWGPEIVGIFFDTVYSLDETSQLFFEGERPALEKALSDWYINLIYGKYGNRIWGFQKYIGFRHVDRGIKNIFMLGMMARIQQIFLQNCVKTFKKVKAFEVYSAFHRITSSISALIAENYDEVKIAILYEGLHRVGINDKLIERIIQIATDKLLEKYREEL